jgi:hypothetical protein
MWSCVGAASRWTGPLYQVNLPTELLTAQLGDVCDCRLQSARLQRQGQENNGKDLFWSLHVYVLHLTEGYKVVSDILRYLDSISEVFSIK